MSTNESNVNVSTIMNILYNGIIANVDTFKSNPKEYIQYFYSLYSFITNEQSLITIINKKNKKVFVNSATAVALNQILDMLIDNRPRDFNTFLLLDDRYNEDFYNNTDTIDFGRTNKYNSYDTSNGILFNIDNDKLNKIKFVPSFYTEFTTLFKILGSKDFALMLTMLLLKTELVKIVYE